MRFVVLAVVAVVIVVDAYGIESALPAGAENDIASEPPRRERVELSREMPVPAVTVPVATEPIAPVPLPKSTCPPERLVCPVPPCDTASVPVIVESVEVAAQAGTPLRSARTCPAVPAVVVASALAPFPYGMVPASIAAQPVPPRATARMPVTSFARSMSEVATAPAVAFRKPDNDPIDREPKKPDVEDAYEAEIALEDA